MGKRFSIGSRYEYCPNGNYWQEISGIFDREIYLFCDCNKCDGQVYVLRARKVNIEPTRLKELVEKTRKLNKLEDIRYKINTTNMQEVENLLSDPKTVIDKETKQWAGLMNH